MARRDITGAVDFGHLETYAAHDAALIEEVLDLFRQQVDLWTPLLDPAAGSEGWRDAAHALKGSALGVGAFAFAEACSDAEAGAGGGVAQRTQQLDRICTTLDAVLHDIAAYRHEQALQGLKTPRA